MAGMVGQTDHPISIIGSPQSVDEWERTRQWVESETGMDLSGTRFPRLRDAVARTLGHPNPDSMLRGILARPDLQSEFLERVTGQLTVGESFFFRNEHHFRVLREKILPQILSENGASREVRMWSAGCATGEEPYSLAILVDELLAGALDWRVSILATDLNPEFLRRAREARYRQWSFRQTEIYRNRSYFTPDEDAFLLVDRLRDRVRFAYLNLVKDVYPSPLTGTVGLDLILFRNVAIYLKPRVTAAILQRFFQALRPGGWLLLGETEVAGCSPGNFEVHPFEQTTLYRKPLDCSPSSLSIAATFVPPALAATNYSFSERLPSVPSLPEWVPLPRVRGPSASNSAPGTLAKSAQASNWDHIERAMAAGNVDEAEQFLDLISAVKQRAVLRLQFVRYLLQRADVLRARQMLDICLNEEPLLLEAQLLKASFADEAGDLAAAEQACRRALYIDPNAPIAHFHLALVLERRGDGQGAARSLKTVSKLIAGKDPHTLVEFGDGVCHGRLKEMVWQLMSKSSV